jgi:hypothetical protein
MELADDGRTAPSCGVCRVSPIRSRPKIRPSVARLEARVTPRFIVEQKIAPIANKYLVYRPDGSDQKGELVAFAQQKGFAVKEKVRFYTDETKANQIFGFRAEKAMDVHGRYFVEDAEGNLLGAFRKDFRSSFLRSTWYLVVNDKPALTVTESNRLLAFLRRYVGVIPIVGSFVDMFLAFFKYHFVFLDPADGNEVGRFQKTAIFTDKYVLSMDDSAFGRADWRVYAALAVALDALQSR